MGKASIGTPGSIESLTEGEQKNTHKAHRMINKRREQCRDDVLFVEINPVVMLTTSVTAPTFVLPVLANTAVTVRHMAAELTAFLSSLTHLRESTHINEEIKREYS